MDTLMDEKELAVITAPLNETEKVAKKGFCHIDKEMIRFKIHFFLLYGAMGSMLPYSPLIAKNRIGISATSLATILTFSMFSSILTKTFLGYVADYFKRMKIMISVLIVMHCLFYLSFLLIPPVKELEVNEQNSPLLSYFKSYEENTKLTIVSINRHTSCNVSANLSPDIKDGILIPVEKTVLFGDQQDAVCFVSRTNSSVVCFKPPSNAHTNEMALNPQRSFCCSIFEQLYIHIKRGYSSEPVSDSAFNLSSFELEMLDVNLTGSSQCAVEFSGKLREFPLHKTGSDFEKHQFWLYAIFMILAGTCISSLFTLSDTVCCESVQKYKRDFGRQRIYSAISWGMLAPLGGLLCDITHDFYSTWTLMAALQCLTLWNLYKMDIVIPQFSQNLGKDIGTILKSPTFLSFQLGVFMNGVWSGIIWFYLIWFVSSLGASTFLCGLIPYVQCFAGELPFMFYSGWIIDKIGHFNISSLSLISYGVRFLCYSYLQNPWLVLPIEIAQGFNYGLLYPALASFAKLSAKPGTEATTQSILFSTHEGLGAGVGCVLTGISFDTYGGNWTFFYFSLFAFGCAFLNICCTFFFGKHFSIAKRTSLPPQG